MLLSIKNIGRNVTEARIGSRIILFSFEKPVAAKLAGRRYVISGKLKRAESKHIRAWLGYSEDPEYINADFMSRLIDV